MMAETRLNGSKTKSMLQQQRKEESKQFGKAFLDAVKRKACCAVDVLSRFSSLHGVM